MDPACESHEGSRRVSKQLQQIRLRVESGQSSWDGSNRVLHNLDCAVGKFQKR